MITIQKVSFQKKLVMLEQRRIDAQSQERSSVARQKCIEEHGLNCVVCNMNFEEVYGEAGKGFIHVHYVVPLHGRGYIQSEF
ncbi:HNH endonuclease [Lysinibacillus odysseyi]|uniref:HNH endonuclease n=1 Tax=Lysinibacillus odysseyi TaxID=202611 RepID=UPI0009DFDC47|nr:hypothetical protein [Lysinibacillus odysseyi]